MHLFAAKGFEASTVREIARACGLTPGAIYRHFDSKHDILYAIVTWAHDEADRAVADAVASSRGGARERLRAALVAFATQHTQNPEATRVSDRDYVFLHEPERSVIVGRRHAMRAVFEVLIQDGVGAGALRLPAVARGRSRAATSLAAIALVNMSVVIAAWFRPDGAMSAEAVAEFHADLGLQLVGAEPAHVRPAAR